MKRICLWALAGLAVWVGIVAPFTFAVWGQTSGGGDSFFGNLLKVYMPRRQCMFNEPGLIALHLVADSLIALSYYSIPIGLVYFVRKRRDIAFNWIFVMFAAFILACGTTHLFGVWAIWQPIYRLDGIVKLITAVLSVATAIVLWPLIPRALALPSPQQLEGRVSQRTTELAQANDALRGEMTARAAAEEANARLAALVAYSDDAIIGKTLEGVITSWNKGAERIFGHTAAEAIGQPISILIPPDRAQEEVSILARLGQGGLIEHSETVRLTKDGRRIDVSVTISPIKDAAGKIIGASKIARDITDRRRAEKEREKLLKSEQAARSEAEHASRMKDEFLATLSHELRTPLNAIYGWSQLLRRHNHSNSNDAELMEGLEVIERNTKLQTQLIEDLLDMSRIISGKIRLDVQEVNLAAILNEVIQSISPAANAKGIRVQAMLDPLAGPVTGDPGRLQQVFWNLLNNAIKFTPKRGSVQVHLERVNSHVEIRVMDSGEGIRAELLPHVFERFRQGDSTSTRRHGGLGLGLAIVKHLVELHGGTAAVWSAGEGQGATFTVALPLRGVRSVPELLAEARAHPTAEPVLGKDLKLPSLAKIRALVVDDDADSRELIRRILTEAGAQVETAGGAAEAMEVIQAAGRRPDILLSDIGMAGEDGYSLIRRVRGLAEGAEIPAIAITAFARSEDRRKAMLAGFQMHVAKPTDAAELVTMVASLTGLIRG
jgi:PAS domain S-box-containing protein